MRHLISLGNRCDVAFQLRMHSGDNTAHFFDWLVTPMDAIEKIIKGNFDIFLPDNLYISDLGITNMIVDRETGVEFRHQFPPYGDKIPPSFLLNYPRFRSKIQYLGRRFNEYVTTKPVTLVRYGTSKGQAEKLEEFLLSQYENADIKTLYLLNSPEEFDTRLGIGRPITASAGPFGNPIEWAEFLQRHDAVDKSFQLSTMQILGEDSAHNMSTANRFSEEQLIHANRVNPNNSDLCFELFSYYKHNKLFRQALEIINECLRMKPESLRFKGEKIVIQWMGGERSSLPSYHALRALADQNNLENFEFDLGSMATDAKLYLEAISHLDTATRLDPISGHAYFGKALCLCKTGRFDLAEHSIELALEIMPRYSRMYHTYVTILLQLNKLDKAVFFAGHANSLEYRIDTAMIVAKALLQQGRYSEAAAHYEQALPRSDGRHRAAIIEKLKFLELRTAQFCDDRL